MSPLWVEAYQLGPAFLQLLLTPSKKYPYYPGGGHNHDLVSFTAFMCDVTSADVCEDKIHVDLIGPGATGTLKLELTGPGGPHTIREETRSYGGYDETFDIPNLSVGEYTKVKATWTVDGFYCVDEFDYHIKVLGVYRHSVYNLPRESCYSGSNEDFCYTAGNCTATSCSWSTDGSGNSDWLDAVELNGSGYSSSLGYVTTEEWCQDHGYPPPEGCNGHLLRDLSITGGCPECSGESLIANSTVAVKPSHPDLDCGDTVCVYTVGTRTVTDKGGGLSIAQLDHFVGLSDCSTATDIGNLMTIKLY